MMDFLAEATRSDKGIHVLDGSLGQTRRSPPLRRALVDQTTSETMTSHAGGTVEPEQHVCRTHQPILVHGVELDTLAIPQDFGSAHQRDVVVMDNIKTLCQDLLDASRLEKRRA